MSEEMLRLQQELYAENDGTPEVHELIQRFQGPVMYDAAMGLMGFADEQEHGINGLREVVQGLGDAIENIQWFKQNRVTSMEGLSTKKLTSVRKSLKARYAKVMGQIALADMEVSLEEPTVTQEECLSLRYQSGTAGQLLETGQVDKQIMALTFLEGDDGVFHIQGFRKAYEDVVSVVERKR